MPHDELLEELERDILQQEKEEPAEELEEEEPSLPDDDFDDDEDRLESFLNTYFHPVGTSLVGTSPKTRDDFVIAGTLVANSTTVTVAGNVGETTLKSYTFRENDWHIGMVIRVFLAGVYTTDDASSTVAIALKVGSTIYHTITTTAATVTSAPWWISWTIVVTTIGSSGTVESFAQAQTNNVNKDSGSSGTQTMNTTATQAISATATWSSGSVGDSITVRQFLIDIKN